MNAPRYSTGVFLLALGLCALPVRAQMPEGEGKDLIQRECTACHDTGRISNQKKTKDDWVDTVSRMVGRGASLNDKEFDTVIDYLVKNFGKEDSKINAKAKK